MNGDERNVKKDNSLRQVRETLVRVIHATAESLVENGFSEMEALNFILDEAEITLGLSDLK